jgi:methionyl-tRNA formyltransferase
MWPWPRAWTTAGGTAVQVHRASLAGETAAAPGRVVATSPALTVACGNAALALDLVQPAGGRPMTGAAFAAGRRIALGHALGQDDAPAERPPLVVPV